MSPYNLRQIDLAREMLLEYSREQRSFSSLVNSLEALINAIEDDSELQVQIAEAWYELETIDAWVHSGDTTLADSKPRLKPALAAIAAALYGVD